MCLRVVFDKIRLLFVCRGLTSDDVAELRAMRHELCNHLCAISGLAQLNESARISAYVSDLLGALALDSRYTGTGNAAVDAVLTAETKKARERNVLLTVRTMPLPDTNLQDCDLTRLISTLLDTGIRHTERLLGHKREVTFTLSTENGYLLLSCTYPCDRETGNRLMVRRLRRTAVKYGGICHFSLKRRTVRAEIYLPMRFPSPFSPVSAQG